MGDDWDGLLSVEEIMGGLPSRRASMVLFAIEGRVAHRAARARRAMARDVSGRTAEQEEQAFLAALAGGGSFPVEPTIQDLERYASHWADLVPADPSMRAALARLIGEKYRVPERGTANLQHAVGIDDPETEARFEQLHGAPIASLFAAGIGWRERFRWSRSRLATWLEGLPPFWIAFALTLTETVGAGVLALPIAFAELGVLGAVVLLAVLGAINVLTIAAMAEAVARNGNVRFGRAYFGRLVHDYLGRTGVVLLVSALTVLAAVVLIAYAVGIASTLHDSVGLPPTVWVLALLAVILWFLRRESLSATVATALLIGACSIVLMTILIIVAAVHVDGSNLRHSEIPFVSGNDFDAGVLELIFGVALLAMFGHTSTANCAAVVLERDPSARSLIRGCAVALVAATVLYMVWVGAVNGSIAPERLASESGTALRPLAELAGPVVDVVGTAFVVLAMGMTSIHFSLALRNTTHDVLGAVPAGIRKALSATPVVVIMLVVVALFALDRESFAGPLGFLGAVTAPLVSGVFAMLMLAAARRKGDCTVGYRWRFVGNRITVGGVCVLFLGAVAAHGLFIWTDPVQRLVGLLTTLITAAFIVAAVRTSFVPRVVAEIRLDADEPYPAVSVVAMGEPAPGVGVAMLGDAVEIRLPAMPVRQLKIWAHRILLDGVSVPIAATVALEDQAPFLLDESTGAALIPANGDARTLVVRTTTVRARPVDATPPTHVTAQGGA